MSNLVFEENKIYKYDDNIENTKLSQIFRQTEFSNTQSLILYRLIKNRNNFHKSYKILSEIMSSKKISIVKTKYEDNIETFQKITNNLLDSIKINIGNEAIHEHEEEQDHEEIANKFQTISRKSTSKKKSKKKSPKQIKKVFTDMCSFCFMFFVIYLNVILFNFFFYLFK
jgi:hypothetical protein